MQQAVEKSKRPDRGRPEEKCREEGQSAECIDENRAYPHPAHPQSRSG
jgi:hypothetical protein